MKYKINKGLITQKVDKETVIFDGDESVLYTFNEAASFIFKQLTLGKKNDEIINSLVKKYEIKEENAKKDLDSFLKDVIAKKIISKQKSA